MTIAMIVGITGSFGSGKTTVARMFAKRGAYVIDADKVCDSLMAPPKKVYKAILKHFGGAILKEDKTINKRKLAEIVFKNRSKLRLLNSLVHPAAIKLIQKAMLAKKKQNVTVIDAALLVESGLYKSMDRVVVVRTNRAKQIDRVIHAKDITRKEVLCRIGMQAPLKKKLALADFIIDNSGSKNETRIQFDRIWKTIRSGLCQ